MALASAAVDDVFAWSLLAVVVALASGDGFQWQVLPLIPYTALVLLVGRPLLQRVLRAATTGASV
jgi:Kef-type K+ transport system membrane component KefB